MSSNLRNQIHLCRQLILGGILALSVVAVSPTLWAKGSEDDAYDPFTDYSDFEETTEEEADINFFKNGRFLNIGFSFGADTYTEGLGRYAKPGTPIGFFLSYFFDLRLAVMFAYYTSNHDLTLSGAGFQTVRSTQTLSTIAFDFKYYLNTQNVTRGFAKLNPYMLIGFSNVTRTVGDSDSLSFGSDAAMGFDLGVGMEFPILDNRMFLGFEGAFHLINFKNETKEIVVGSTATGIYLTGDVMTVMVNLGTNF